jgi:hypothetical protein
VQHRIRRSAWAAVTAAIGLGLLLAPIGSGVAALSLTVNLDQWASTDLAWQNGNLNGNNSRYPEGGIVPFRVTLEGLKPGNHSIHVNYDFTASGHKAYDFLATWNVTNAQGKICAMSGGAISSMCPSLPSPTTMAFPSDLYHANGLTVQGAEAYSGTPRRLTMWGGTITSISGPTHAGSPDGNSTADFYIRFRSTGAAVLFAWGGHLAQSAYWDRSRGGPSDGAGEVSGAPWHMRTLQLDGSGNKNQDRSIQPSAIVGELPPRALAPTPPPTPRPTPTPTPRVTPRPAAGATPIPDHGTTGGQPPDEPIDPNLTPPATSTVPSSTGVESSPLPALITVFAVLAGAILGAARLGRRPPARRGR